MKNTVQIRIDPSDKARMMTECKKLFLEHHPELKGMHMTQKHMFNQLVTFYLE